MDLRAHIDEEHLSHAYIIESEREPGLAALHSLFASFGIATKANPDYHEYQLETLLLNDAHEIRREVSMRGANGAKKIFVVAFNAIINESQNALLKTIEEPTEDTHFFFLVRTSAMLLPTVRSRMQLVRMGNTHHGEDLTFAKKFLTGSVSERMKMIKRMTKAKTDDKPRAKEEARMFVGSLEPTLHAMLEAGDRSVAPALKDILTVKYELSLRSPSVKLLLEHLALTLPQDKKAQQ